MTNRQVFWHFALMEWQKNSFCLVDLWHVYEQMRGSPIAGAHFSGKIFGDC